MNHFEQKKQRLLVLSVMLISVFFTQCKGKAEQQQEGANQTVQAEVIEISAENTLVEQSYPASIEGKINVEIRPQVSGYIDQIFVDEGQYVKAGQPLFQINSSVFKEQRNAAAAALEVSKSQLNSAKLDLEKYELLSEKKVVTDFQYKKARASYESAKAAVKLQEAELGSAQVNLGFTSIKASSNGYIGRIPKRLGTLVSATDEQPITTFTQVDEVFVYFSIPETEILNINESIAGKSLADKLKSFQHIDLQLANGKLYTHRGKIDMMDGQFDKNTGSVLLRASFANPEHLLRSGNTGKVILKMESKGIFKIPVLATYELQDKIFVGKLDAKNQVQRMQLRDYLKSGDYYIVKSGFEEGDRIIAKELGSIPENSIIASKKAN